MFDGELKTQTPVQKALERAAQIMSEKGLCQGGYSSNFGQVCTMTALVRGTFGDGFTVYHDDVLNADITREVLEKFSRATDLSVGTIDQMHALVCNWNNAPERTTEQVVEALLKASRS